MPPALSLQVGSTIGGIFNLVILSLNLNGENLSPNPCQRSWVYITSCACVRVCARARACAPSGNGVELSSAIENLFENICGESFVDN